ncbi:hypothetical protein AOLI_G00165160 [Acnodon oligacanthus]
MTHHVFGVYHCPHQREREREREKEEKKTPDRKKKQQLSGFFCCLSNKSCSPSKKKLFPSWREAKYFPPPGDVSSPQGAEYKRRTSCPAQFLQPVRCGRSFTRHKVAAADEQTTAASVRISAAQQGDSFHSGGVIKC